MSNKILTLAVFSAISLTLLTACGSGSDNTGQNISDRIASIRSVGTSNQNNSGGNVNYSATPDTFSVISRENDYVMTVNGVNYVIIDNPTGVSNPRSYDANQVIYAGVDNVGLLLLDASDNLRGVLDGTDATVQGSFVRYVAGSDSFHTSRFNSNFTYGYALVGIQTSASVVQSQTATATYNGTINISLARTQIGSLPNALYIGNMSMNVDFNKNIVAGTAEITATALDGSSGATGVNGGSIHFASAPIVGNGFAGDITFDGQFRQWAGISNNPTGNYAGNFFGPNADDLAGVLSFSSLGITNNAISVGGFRGDRR